MLNSPKAFPNMNNQIVIVIAPMLTTVVKCKHGTTADVKYHKMLMAGLRKSLMQVPAR